KTADIDHCYANPPFSTREILHPEQYWVARQRRPPLRLVLPDLSSVLGPGWSKATAGSIGELGLTVLTGSRGPTCGAKPAGGGEACLRRKPPTARAAGRREGRPAAARARRLRHRSRCSGARPTVGAGACGDPASGSGPKPAFSPPYR